MRADGRVPIRAAALGELRRIADADAVALGDRLHGLARLIGGNDSGAVVIGEPGPHGFLIVKNLTVVLTVDAKRARAAVNTRGTPSTYSPRRPASVSVFVPYGRDRGAGAARVKTSLSMKGLGWWAL